MLKNIKSADLKKGMFVVLPGSWLRHSFLKNRFLITSEDQIKKIIASGLREVMIDTQKGYDFNEEVEHISHGEEKKAVPVKWEPEKVVSKDFKEAINSREMAPEKKAEVVYNYSLGIMKDLFESPKAENIKEVKNAVYDIVNLVLSEEETPACLLKITNHDFYTYTHSVNVGVLSISLAKVLLKDQGSHNMEELGAGFFLHDLGKVNIDAAVLNKPGRLDDDEMKHMRTHPYQGYKILKETNQLNEEIRVIAMQHHERDDGTGYPLGLKGDEIHAYGRICCIADVFDALTAKRSYKPSLSPFEALKIMKEQMLGHFSEKIFQNFVLLFK